MGRYMLRFIGVLLLVVPTALAFGNRASAVHTTSTGCSYANTGVFSFNGAWTGTTMPAPPTSFSLTLPSLNYVAGEILSTTLTFSGAITSVDHRYEFPPGNPLASTTSTTSPSIHSYTFPLDASGVLSINLDFITSGPYMFTVTTTCTPVPDPVTVTPVSSPTPTTTPAPVAGDCTNDARINSVCAEQWQTAAIYCQPGGVIDVYAVKDSVGTLVIRATPEEIDAVGIPPEGADPSEMLIEQSADGQVRLYRLPDGSFQVNSPINDAVRGYLVNGYVFTWPGCG